MSNAFYLLVDSMYSYVIKDKVQMCEERLARFWYVLFFCVGINKHLKNSTVQDAIQGT